MKGPASTLTVVAVGVSVLAISLYFLLKLFQATWQWILGTG